MVAAAPERCEEVGGHVVEATAGEAPTRPVNLAPYATRDVRLGLRAAEVPDRALGREERKQTARSVLGIWPGRFEVHEVNSVPVVVDGGHNPPGVRATLEAVRSAYGERPPGAVFGVLRDKDIESMLTGLQKEARVLVLTLPEGERAADPAHLLREHGPRDREGRRARVEADVVRAVEAAVEEMREAGGVVLVTGSPYTGVLASILRWLREE